MQTSHQKFPVEQSSQNDLQRDALHYLKEFGPLNWGALYVRFDEAGSGDIGPALIDLQAQQYNIEVRSDSIVKITQMGMAHL